MDRPTKTDEIFKDRETKGDEEEETRRLLADRLTPPLSDHLPTHTQTHTCTLSEPTELPAEKY